MWQNAEVERIKSESCEVPCVLEKKRPKTQHRSSEKPAHLFSSWWKYSSSQIKNRWSSMLWNGQVDPKNFRQRNFLKQAGFCKFKLTFRSLASTNSKKCSKFSWFSWVYPLHLPSSWINRNAELLSRFDSARGHEISPTNSTVQSKNNLF